MAYNNIVCFVALLLAVNFCSGEVSHADSVHVDLTKSAHNTIESAAAAALSTEAAVAQPLSGSGVHCYVCNSLYDKNCETEDSLKKTMIQECPDKDGKKSTGCWMIQQWVEYDESTELKHHERVIRQCAYNRQDSNCIYRSGFGGMVNHCFCNTTACNFGYNIQGNVLMTILPSILFFVIMKAYL